MRTPTAEDQARAVRLLTERHGLLYFIRRFWHTIESVSYRETAHIRAIARFLEALTDGRVRTGVVNVPPGTGKSTLVSVLWPAYLWTKSPGLRVIATAYGDALVLRDARRFLQVVQSPLYQAAWPEVRLTKPNPPASEIENTARGRRYSAQIGAQITGYHCDLLVIDDPIKPADALTLSGTELTKVNDLIKSTLTSRFAPGVDPRAVCIMQRLAAGDPAEMLLDWGYEHLCLPMRYVPDCPWDRGTSLGRLDWRTEPGELLCPELRSEEAVQFLETGLETPANISAQLQQNPTPAAGAFFEAAWFRTWDQLPRGVRYVQSWDLGFKGKQTKGRDSHSRVHGALWAFTRDDYYLVDEVIGTWNYPQTKAAFAGCQAKNARDPKAIDALVGDARRKPWPKCEAILVEDKANGPALIAELKDLVYGIKPIQPDGSKEDRAARNSFLVEQGRVYLPDEPWAEEFKTELVRFPRQKHNDRVDTTTQALDYMRDKTRRLAESLGRLIGTK